MQASSPPSTGFSHEKIGRRTAARLRLSLPAKLVTIYETRRCIILNLSQTGVQLGLERPLRQGDAAFLQCADIEQFGTVVRSDPGSNALEFDVPLTHGQVLEIREFADNFDELERSGFRRIARDWITGGG
ncbi:MAG: PilZ domain-containing protein [Erythrobacter sp.]|nr:PilZ domain-containing protein [Erythrobacter sp.]